MLSDRALTRYARGLVCPGDDAASRKQNLQFRTSRWLSDCAPYWLRDAGPFDPAPSSSSPPPPRMRGDRLPVALPGRPAPALHWSRSVAEFRTACPKSGKFNGTSEVSRATGTDLRTKIRCGSFVALG